ncbi:MAG: M3 family metallopeptidase, partial [Myxococcota bacterium]
FAEIRPEHVVPAIEARLQECAEALDAVEASPGGTYESLVARLDRLAERLTLPWGTVSHLMAVKNSPELRAAYESVQPAVIELSMRFSQSRPIFNALLAIRDGQGWFDLDPTQRRIVQLSIRDAELAGVGLDGPEKDRFNEIALELSKLQTDFSNHVLDATKAYSKVLTHPADTEGLPESLRELLAANAEGAGHAGASATEGPWAVTLDFPSFVGFMKHSPRRELREEIYRAYVTRASDGEGDNSPLLDRILALRTEKARLLKFDHYADLSLASKMAPEVSAVESLLEELRVASIDAARSDVDDLKALAEERSAPEATDFRPWDFHFWSERLREKRFEYEEEELRKYFPMSRVLEGLFDLARDLFGVEIREASERPSVWHDDVRYFEVLDDSGASIAGFYFDAFSRPAEKRGGAWMNDVLGRSRALASAGTPVRNPVAHMVCNGTPAVSGKPSTMTFTEVETLFHEFGHALQHMLTRVDEVQAAGINNVEWDAVELPSQFMENWVYEKDVLIGMTEHIETGAALPEAMFEKLNEARTFQAGYAMLRQLNFARTDLELHARYAPGAEETPFDVHRRISKDTTVIDPIPEDRFLNSFTHIFAGGYAAGYYSYKWAEVLSADAFSAFEEAGLTDREARRTIGQRFRETVLALGGSQPAMDVFEAFRGRGPSTEALLRHYGLRAA